MGRPEHFQHDEARPVRPPITDCLLGTRVALRGKLFAVTLGRIHGRLIDRAGHRISADCGFIRRVSRNAVREPTRGSPLYGVTRYGSLNWNARTTATSQCSCDLGAVLSDR